MVALIPEIFLGPIAGAYVDRWNRRLILIASDASVALLTLLLAYFFWIEAVHRHFLSYCGNAEPKIYWGQRIRIMRFAFAVICSL